MALVFCGLPFSAMVFALIYTSGRIIYSSMYSQGNPDKRIPGLIVSDFFGLLIARGILIIFVVQQVLAGRAAALHQ